MQKKSIALAIATLTLFSCRREKHYVCQCQYVDSFVTHTIGRTSSDDAYAKCQSFKDGANNCFMEVRN